jgi:hypothetical protein
MVFFLNQRSMRYCVKQRLIATHQAYIWTAHSALLLHSSRPLLGGSRVCVQSYFWAFTRQR